MKVRDVELGHVSRYGLPWQKSRLTVVADENRAGRVVRFGWWLEAAAETAGSRGQRKQGQNRLFRCRPGRRPLMRMGASISSSTTVSELSTVAGNLEQDKGLGERWASFLLGQMGVMRPDMAEHGR